MNIQWDDHGISYPITPHIETVVKLKRIATKSNTFIYENLWRDWQISLDTDLWDLPFLHAMPWILGGEKSVFTVVIH